MINLRYHIVSITAVFLALGIGLTLGSTFLDRVTVDTLKHQLDTVEVQVRDTRTENEALAARVDSLERRDAGFADELPERALAGHLDAVPVLVVAVRGVDESLHDAAVGALASAGADVSGTWWLTDRWALDDPDEVSELASVLGVSTDDPDRLRRNGAIRVAELLTTAAQPPVTPDPAAVDAAVPGGEAQVPPAPEAEEPALVASLEEAGFLDYEALAGAPDDRVLLPGASARFVVVSGSLPESGQNRFAAALLEEAIADGAGPFLAAQGEVDLRDDDGPAPEDERRTTFVGPLREGELTRDRLSTIDDLDTAAGLAALVLAVEDLGDLRTGHFGVASGAARLLPGSDSET